MRKRLREKYWSADRDEGLNEEKREGEERDGSAESRGVRLMTAYGNIWVNRLMSDVSEAHGASDESVEEKKMKGAMR
jgi:hypothetical protein